MRHDWVERYVKVALVFGSAVVVLVWILLLVVLVVAAWWALGYLAG